MRICIAQISDPEGEGQPVEGSPRNQMPCEDTFYATIDVELGSLSGIPIHTTSPEIGRSALKVRT